MNFSKQKQHTHTHIHCFELSKFVCLTVDVQLIISVKLYTFTPGSDLILLLSSFSTVVSLLSV